MPLEFPLEINISLIKQFVSVDFDNVIQQL